MWYIAAILVLLGAFPIDAAAEPAPIRVVVSPFVYLPAPAAVAPSAGRDAVVGGMQEWVAGETSAFALVSVDEVQRRVLAAPAYQQTVELARLRAELGIEKYRELDPLAAASNLGVAREQFARADHDLVAPGEVSEVLLFLALALLGDESANVTAPLDVMKDMIVVDPGREVRAGAFPDEVVRFYEGARLELERDVRERGPGEALPARIAKLAAGPVGDGGTQPADYVLVGNVLGAPGNAVELVVWLFDARAEQFQQPASLLVTDPSPARLREAANRLASRLLSCLVQPAPDDVAPIAPSSGSGPFALQLSLMYSSYLQFPEVGGQPVEPFGNIGALIGGAFFLTEEFAVLAAFEFLSSRSEYSGLVKPGFTTLRTLVGAEIGVTWWRLRLAIGTLLEAAAVSRITTCPGLGVEDRRACTPADELSGRALFGVNARPRLSYRALRAMEVYLAGSTSFYFLPLANDSLNYLTAGEAGLQYRF